MRHFNLSIVPLIILVGTCLMLSACPLVRGTGNAIEAVGSGVGDAVEGTGHAIGQTGRELAHDPMN